MTVVKEVMACDVSWRLATGDGLDKKPLREGHIGVCGVVKNLGEDIGINIRANSLIFFSTFSFFVQIFLDRMS